MSSSTPLSLTSSTSGRPAGKAISPTGSLDVSLDEQRVVGTRRHL